MVCVYCNEEESWECPGLGWCHCGCGEQTETISERAVWYIRGRRLEAGVTPRKYISGHHSLRTNFDEVDALQARAERYFTEGVCFYCGENCPVEPGQCHCGCRQQTVTRKKSNYSKKWVKGVPNKFIHGHATRVLSLEQAAEIRERVRKDPTITNRELAEEFGVDQRTISGVLLLDSYKEAGIPREDHAT